MSEIPAGRHDDPGRYEIRLKGHLDARWAAWFDGLTLTLPLISVTYVEPSHPPMPTIDTR